MNRDDGGSRVLPVDVLLAAYNAAMSVVWLAAAPSASPAPWLAAAHAAAAALPWLLRNATGAGARGRPSLREAYPLLGLALFWTELGWLHGARPAVPHDALVAGWDQGLFGCHPHAVWRSAMPAPWLAETMFFSYFVYYVLIAAPPIAVALTGRREAFRDMVLRLMTTYLTCYAFYALFPVLGPRAAEAASIGSGSGFFHGLVERAQAVGDSPGTAFPSSHAAGAMTTAWLACRWLGPRVGALLVAQGVLVLFATVYTQNHFAVDALAGAAWAFGAQTLVVPALVWSVRRFGGCQTASLDPGGPPRIPPRAPALPRR